MEACYRGRDVEGGDNFVHNHVQNKPKSTIKGITSSFLYLCSEFIMVGPYNTTC